MPATHNRVVRFCSHLATEGDDAADMTISGPLASASRTVRRSRSTGYAAVVLALVVAAPLLATAGPVPTAVATASEADGRSCHEQLVTMKDGVRLHSWVNHAGAPGAPERRPVLMELDNYTLPDDGCPRHLPTNDISNYAHALDPEVSERFTQVHVNLRGTGSAEGSFDMIGPATQADVREVVAWARTQPWSTGEIVLLGWSGTGFAVHHALEEPGVEAAIIYTSCADLFRCMRPGGVANVIAEGFMTFVGLSYTSGLEARHRLGLAANPTVPEQLAAFSQAYAATRTAPVYNDYWSERSSLHRLGRSRVPVLYTSDPYDILSSPYDGYRATPGARLVLGLGHTSTDAGATEGSRHAELVRGAVDRFVRHHGLGDDVGLDDDPPVVLVTTTGSMAGWRAAHALVRDEAEWPLPDTKWTRLYFDGARSGSAASLNDGGLQASPGEEGVDPSVLLGGPDHHGDFRVVRSRADAASTDLSRDESAALTYTTPEFVRDVEVSGPITLRVVASTDASDFDWSVRLTDVWPDGRSEWITDGQLRASMRRVDEERSLRNDRGDIVRPFLPLDDAEPVPANQPVEYLIELMPTSNVFRAGHRLRIDVFPVASSGPDLTSLGTVGRLDIHRGPNGSSVLLPLIPARCHLGTAMHHAVEPVSCAPSWKRAVAATAGR